MPFHAVRASVRNASKALPPCSVSSFTRALSRLTKEIPTRAVTARLVLVSKETNAAAASGPTAATPGTVASGGGDFLVSTPDCCSAVFAAGGTVPVLLPEIVRFVGSTVPSAAATPALARGRSNVTKKFSGWWLPAPQTPPLSVKPDNVLVPMVIDPVAELNALAASTDR